MKTVKMLTILALVTMVCLNEVSEASFLDDFNTPGLVTYTGSNSYGSGGSYTVAYGKLRITTGFDNTYSVMTTNTVVFNVGETLSLDVPAISGTGSVFMMCSTSAFQPNGTPTFGFRFRRDGPGYARMELCPGGILTPYPLDPSPDKPAILMVKRTSDTGFLYLIKIEGEVTSLGSFTLPQLSGNIYLHIGAQAYRQISGTTFAFDNLQVYKSPNFTDITVLTYNTHLFEDSTIECIARWGFLWHEYNCEDGTRREDIASKVETSGADIVALQEVWSPEWQRWFITRLSGTYPYARSYDPMCRASFPWYLELAISSCWNASDDWKFHTLGNGLVLLSKWPLQDVGFARFPTFEYCSADQACEAWSDKGVLTATVNVDGAPIRIGISHALTGPDDDKSNWDTDYVGTAAFQLNGEAYIFSLNNINGLVRIRRFEDYSYFNGATQTQKHGAGWKQIYEGLWGFGYVAVVSFELDGHPYLFGLKSNNQGRIFRINDDPATGWTQVYEGPMSSTYVPVTSFELDGHPYLLAVRDGNQGRILRINDDPWGWSDVYDGVLPLEYAAITSFELDSHPYLFAISNSNQGRILRINDDPWGWSDVYEDNWPAANIINPFELDSHPYIFTYSNTNHWAYIYRINDDPCTGWSDVSNGNMVFTDYIAIKSFDMNGHPYLFGLRNCCAQEAECTGCGYRAGQAYLKRINDDPNTGWENLYQLEDIRIIRDQTVVDEDGPPAIMMGDLNIHRGKYGIMDELFRKAGAVDVYIEVNGTGEGGETIDIYANGLAQYFHKQQGFPWPPVDPDLVDRIDYVYVKPSGAGLRLVPTKARVDRGWKYGADNMDLSDHYPLFVKFRLETGCKVHIKGDFDCDGFVDLADLAILCSAWLSGPGSGVWDRACDISAPGDDFIDMKDFEEFARQWRIMAIHNVTRNKWYASIQAAINDANDGEEIEVAPGTYYGGINFDGKAIRLYSSGGHDVTTIDGSGAYHVVQCINHEDANTILEGFTITGGNANGSSAPDNCGGGMLNSGSSPTVINCNFSGNPAGANGGGMSNYQGSNPTVTDCTFSGNSGYIGGAMCNDQGSNPTVTDCIFLSNAASLHGGGMHNEHSDPKVTNCIFLGNTASAHGGGMMNNYGSVSYTANCVFIGNTANGWGGGMCNTSCSPYFINCTFRGNTASSGGAIYSDNSYTNIQNCILWADGANEIVYSSGTMSVTYSDVQGGHDGTGNIDADPLFVNAIAGNLRLSSGSPCIDKGSNAGVPPEITTDLDGNPRVSDGDSNGTVIVDMGAYEYLITTGNSFERNLEAYCVLASHWLENP